MMSAEQNDRLTRVGPGTPAGALLRQYWQPIALLEELQGARPIRPVRLMGQNLVLFRDESGRLGLIDRDCPHRGADLAYGRLEDGGLRCPFHGWLFDVDGRCLETPAEPIGSRFHEKVRQAAYPVVEKSGLVFAYLGEGAPPPFPDFDCFRAPDSHVFAFKGLFDCNWLQALEVGIDPAHASFLHRFFEDEDTGDAYGRQFRGASADSEWPMTRVMREFARPEIRVESVPHGLRLTTLRPIDGELTHVRVTNLVFPQAFVIPMSTEMTITQWHVPVDDTRCYWVAIFTSFTTPVDKQRMREQRLATYTLPDYLPRRNRDNEYGYDPAEQRKATYTGMGMDINIHDQWAIESQGPIQDRTREHLATSDRAIIAYRRALLSAMEAREKGEALPGRPADAEAAARLRGPATIDGIARGVPWNDYWVAADAARRALAPWDASLGSPQTEGAPS
jgi:phenylpropionate dioxygenase-like ring-hydroxylating dioxygenase large terminal subunit